MDETLLAVRQFLAEHGWPTTVLAVICIGLFWICRWAAPRLEGWVNSLVAAHLDLVNSLRSAVEDIKDALLTGQSRYEVGELEKAKTLLRIESKVDSIKTVVDIKQHSSTSADPQRGRS